jgi:integrase/recombinase XerD
VPAADAFLRHLRFGRDGAESTTRAYAGAIALFLRWCERSGRDWQVGAAQLGSFMTWLAHAGPQVSGIDAAVGAVVLAGPGTAPARSARRVNAVLTAVHGMAVHAVTEGTAPGSLVRLLFEVADDLDLPDAARGEDGPAGWRVRARHRLHEPERPVGRASDADIVALLGACCSARDRLVVLLMARAGLRRGEVAGLRRSDVHLLASSRVLGCEVGRAHLHVVRRPGNPNGGEPPIRPLGRVVAWVERRCDGRSPPRSAWITTQGRLLLRRRSGVNMGTGRVSADGGAAGTGRRGCRGSRRGE